VLSDYFDRGNFADAQVFRSLMDNLDVQPMVSGAITESAEAWLCESGGSYELRVLDCGLKRENVIFAQQTEYGLERAYDFAIRVPLAIARVTNRATGEDIAFTQSDGLVRFRIDTGSQHLVIGLG
jgi:hypothetical protein